MSLDETQEIQSEEQEASTLEETTDTTDTQAAQSQESETSLGDSTGTESAEDQPKDLSDEEIEASDAPTAVKRALRRANRKLQRERQTNAELKRDVANIKSQLSTDNQSRETSQLLKDLEQDLNLDADSTAKFYKAVEKIAGRGNKPSQPVMDDRQAKFSGRIETAKTEYDDWDDMAPYMYDVMKGEMKKLADDGDDPEDAYDKSVHSYYAKAVRLKAKADLDSNSQQSINKNNANNRAGTESSKGSPGKPVGSTRLTQEIYEKNRTNPVWVKKNIDAITKAAAKGVLRSR